MFQTVIHGESLVGQFCSGGVTFEVVHCPFTLWCGALGYASNCADEPDIGALLEKYQAACETPKSGLAQPDWSCAISIDYWRSGVAPRGMMFAQQVLSDRQEPVHNVYAMPESLFIRVANTAEVARAAFGREVCELHELFGVVKGAMDAQGYAINDNGAQEIEMYNYSAGLFYAYVPVRRREPQGA